MNPGSLYLQGAPVYRRAPTRRTTCCWPTTSGPSRSEPGCRPRRSGRRSGSPSSRSPCCAPAGVRGRGFLRRRVRLRRSFPWPSADYGRGLFSPPPSGTCRSDRSLFALGVKLEAGARPQVQVGHRLARSSVARRALRRELSRRGPRLLRSPVDNVVYAYGNKWQSDTDLAYAGWRQVAHPAGLFSGRALLLNLVFYPNDAYGPGEAQSNSNSPSARRSLGALAAADTDKTRNWDELFVTGTTQFYVVDRFHTGATTPAALPFVSLSPTATGDL